MRSGIRALAPGVVLAAVVAGCAAPLLPSARSLRGQDERAMAWDSRRCAWAAQDVAGWDPTLSSEENRIVAFFVVGTRWSRESQAKFDRTFEECMTRRGYELSRRAEGEAK
jgi:hypothetical protein